MDTTNGRVLTVLGVGHVVWALIAHREGLAAVAADGVIDTVGDGVFVQEHARDDRAAAFWFVVVGPLLSAIGMLMRDAERRGDQTSVRRASRLLLGVSTVGALVIPRSGFPAGIAISLRGSLAGGRARS